MSLLMKALDKAQAEKAKAEGAKVKQEEYTLKNKKIEASEEKTIAVNEASNLSLSPPKESLISKQKKLVKAKAILVEQKKIRAAHAFTIDPVDEAIESPDSIQTPAHIKPSPLSNTVVSPSVVASNTSTISSPTPIQAANVFTAKQSQETNANGLLLLIAAIGLITIIAMGIYYYQFVDTTSEVAVPQPQIAIKTIPATLPQTEEPLVTESVVAKSMIAENQAQQRMDVNSAVQKAEPGIETSVFSEQKRANVEPVTVEGKTANVVRSLDRNEVLKSVNSKVERSNFTQTKKIVVSESASIQITKNQQKRSINPVLMRAYTAYSVGNDTQARNGYKEVLRSDGLNIDAMLGLGAIATRQGRTADANDWYKKVLQLAPRNDIAKTALLYAQTQTNPQLGDESQIKSMLVKSPNNASLYAALGDVYIKQKQWPAAQQAYFEAYRLNSSADNAFNLAISLDQMGKPKLALPYYQLALEKATQSQTTAIDKTVLQARILSIQ